MVQDTIVKVIPYFALILLRVITMKLVRVLIMAPEKIVKKMPCIVTSLAHVIVRKWDLVDLQKKITAVVVLG